MPSTVNIQGSNCCDNLIGESFSGNMGPPEIQLLT
jgi:hypothetical protein